MIKERKQFEISRHLKRMDETYNNEKEQYLVAPFIESRKVYRCECVSCKASVKYHNLVKWLLCIGVFFPFTIFYEIGLYLYVNMYLNHGVVFPKFTDIDYPTEFERKVFAERHLVKIQTEIERELKDQTLLNLDKPEISIPKEIRNTSLSFQQEYRYQVLKQIATDIVNSHDYYRGHFLKWTLRCIGVLIAQCIITLLLIVICFD